MDTTKLPGQGHFKELRAETGVVAGEVEPVRAAGHTQGLRRLRIFCSDFPPNTVLSAEGLIYLNTEAGVCMPCLQHLVFSKFPWKESSSGEWGVSRMAQGMDE